MEIIFLNQNQNYFWQLFLKEMNSLEFIVQVFFVHLKFFMLVQEVYLNYLFLAVNCYCFIDSIIIKVIQVAILEIILIQLFILLLHSIYQLVVIMVMLVFIILVRDFLQPLNNHILYSNNNVLSMAYPHQVYLKNHSIPNDGFQNFISLMVIYLSHIDHYLDLINIPIRISVY